MSTRRIMPAAPTCTCAAFRAELAAAAERERGLREELASARAQHAGPVAEPGVRYCDRCDGVGWHEGGPKLATTCDDCGGTGVVGDPDAVLAHVAREHAEVAAIGERVAKRVGETIARVKAERERDAARARIARATEAAEALRVRVNADGGALAGSLWEAVDDVLRALAGDDAGGAL